MTTTSDMNIIVGQGTAIKEVHNVKKQNLEVNQHFVAQDSEGQKEKEKTKVQKSDKKDIVEMKSDKDNKNKKKRKDKKKDAGSETLQEEISYSEGNLIDITV